MDDERITKEIDTDALLASLNSRYQEKREELKSLRGFEAWWRMFAIRHYIAQKDPFFSNAIITHLDDPEPRRIINGLYRNIRIHDYQPDERDQRMITRTVKQETTQVESWKDDTWQWRSPRDVTRIQANSRISLNVHADPKLIPLLDDFCCRHKLSYKTSRTFDYWKQRHDPITIYIPGEATPHMLSEISDIVAPYVRGHALIGQKIAEGVALDKSATHEDVLALLQQAHALHPDLEKIIRSAVTEYPDGELAISSGSWHCAELVMADFKRYQKLYPSQFEPKTCKQR